MRPKRTASRALLNCQLGINEDGTFSEIGMKEDETFTEYGRRVLSGQNLGTKNEEEHQKQETP